MHLSAQETSAENPPSPIYQAFDEAGLIGCIETDEQLSTTYKEKLDFSSKTEEDRVWAILQKTDFLGNMPDTPDLSETHKDYLQGCDKPHAPLRLDLFKGQINMADDFNEPLPDRFWLEGKL